MTESHGHEVLEMLSDMDDQARSNLMNYLSFDEVRNVSTGGFDSMHVHWSSACIVALHFLCNTVVHQSVWQTLARDRWRCLWGLFLSLLIGSVPPHATQPTDTHDGLTMTWHAA